MVIFCLVLCLQDASLEFVDFAADGGCSCAVVCHFRLDGHLHGNSRVGESLRERDVSKHGAITKKEQNGSLVIFREKILATLLFQVRGSSICSYLLVRSCEVCQVFGHGEFGAGQLSVNSFLWKNEEKKLFCDHTEKKIYSPLHMILPFFSLSCRFLLDSSSPHLETAFNIDVYPIHVTPKHLETATYFKLDL